jgi:hypothetical protein
MEKTKDTATINQKATEAGINQKRLDADIRATYLPEKGTFVGWDISSPGTPTAHLRMVCEDGNSISVGTLKALAYKGAIAEAKFRKVERADSPMVGKFVLVGTEAVNPNLGGKMADVVAKLVGKDFEASPVELVTLGFNPDGYKSEADAKKALINRTFYTVKIKS